MHVQTWKQRAWATTPLLNTGFVGSNPTGGRMPGGVTAPASVASSRTITEEVKERIANMMTSSLEEMMDEEMIENMLQQREIKTNAGHSQSG
jgi:hypothetical protein